MEHQTDYGKVSTEELIRVYHMWKKMIKRNVECRNEFNQSETGKQLNRERAKKYYEEHRDEILAKRKAKYQNGVDS
jgi:hypothetical protein